MQILHYDKATIHESDKIEIPSSKLPSNIKDVFNKTTKIEISTITNNTIELKEALKVTTVEKVAVWLYSNTNFLGYYDIEVSNGTTKIIGLAESLKETEAESGEHNIILLTESNEPIGYINIDINEQKKS